jgi:cytochrome P450
MHRAGRTGSRAGGGRRLTVTGAMSKSIDEAIVDPVICATPHLYDEIFTRLRRDEPVRSTAPAGYRPFWTVAKYDDIVEVQRQDDIFINEPRLNLASIAEETKTRTGAGKGGSNALRMMINMDGPDHRAHREITQAWFLPPNLKRLEAGLAGLAKESVDRMERLGGACDFVKDVAVWYPLRVIMAILGAPREDDGKMLALNQAVFGSYDPEIAGAHTGLAARRAAIREFFRYFDALSAERRKNPTRDLASVIANARLGGKPIGELEARSYFLIVATAGHDTTSAVAAGGLLALMQNPCELAKLRNNPGLLPCAVEEMLRWVTPAKYFFRTATEDYRLRGKRIEAGQSLMMCYHSANRDEEVFENPFTFRIDRAPNRHLAFGHGAHICLGKHLAKMELTALYRELLSRLGSVELAGEPAWVLSDLVIGLKKLPIRYAMRKRAA